MKRILLIFAVIFTLAAVTKARELPVNSPEDNEKISSILGNLRSGQHSFGARIVMAATALEGSSEDDYYTTDSVGSLRINMDAVSPLMFVNTVIALAKASEMPGNVDINTFSEKFEDIACRRGEYTGFPSIMYHGADWIGDNVSRGNVRELTENYSGVVARTKSLDEMTRKRKDFAALADSSTFEKVRMIEMGFRTHRIPTLKKETIKKKEVLEDLRNGDIVLLVPNRDGVDIYDIGFVSVENDVPYLIHLSPQTRKVVKEKDDLARYMALMTKHFQGYRILRVTE